MYEMKPDSIRIPAPTAWPFIAAFGLTLMFTGIVTHEAVSMVGAAVLIRAAVGWWHDVLPDQKEEEVEVTVSEPAVARSSLAVDYLTAGVDDHRVRLPLEVHPYRTGLFAGIAGALAMALVAMLFGLIAQGSIWYPINLLAAGILSSLAGAPASQLRAFSGAGLIAGSIIHGVLSLLVGMIYTVSLPMFPRGAELRSGLVTPVLWSGIVAATLSVVNPTLNARIDWKWFVGSQIAFGLAAGFVVARSEKIETMQSWPLIQRAGLDAPHRASEEKHDS